MVGVDSLHDCLLSKSSCLCSFAPTRGTQGLGGCGGVHQVKEAYRDSQSGIDIH